MGLLMSGTQSHSDTSFTLKSYLTIIKHSSLFKILGQRRSNAFLDVPTVNMHHLQISDPEDEDLDRLRTFSASKGGKYSFIKMGFPFQIDILIRTSCIITKII